MSRGFILVEMSVTYLVLSIAVVALVPAFIITIRGSKATEQIAEAGRLSAQLLEEIRLRKWDQATPAPSNYIAAASALGADAGESAADKRTFNDIDDFNGWNETGVLDPVMRPVAGFSAYNRSVTVSYTDSNFNVTTATSDFKLVTVCTSVQKLKPSCLQLILANR